MLLGAVAFHYACGVTKARDAHWEYVMLIAFTQQQWLLERSSMICLYLHCLFCYNKAVLVDNTYVISDISDNMVDGKKSIRNVLIKTRNRTKYAMTELAARACLQVRTSLPRHHFKCRATTQDLDFPRSALCCCRSVRLGHHQSPLHSANG